MYFQTLIYFNKIKKSPQNIRGCLSIINYIIFIKINFDIHSLKLTFE